MISTVLALIAVTGPVQEPIDFQLGWKQGDKFAYILSAKGGELSDQGRLNITVTKADAKGFTISWPTVDMSGYSEDLAAGTIQLDKHGLVTSKSTTLHALMIMVQMTLPGKPIALGGSFKVNATALEEDDATALEVKLEMTGKLAKIDETKGRVAHFSFEGTMQSPDGVDLKIKISSVFDMVRGIFTSSVFEWVDYGTSFTLKLVEKGEAVSS